MYKSPYRGPESALTPVQRELVSRGTMLLLGLLMVWLGTRGCDRLVEVRRVAATQRVATPILPSGGTRRYDPDRVPGLFWVGVAALVGFGGLLAVAAVVPVGLMEKVIAPRPPTTGDRTPGLDDQFRDVTHPWYGGRWWRFWRWWRP